MNKVVLFMTSLLSVSLMSCGNDDNNSSSSDFGEINITVTGQLEDNFSGMADFHQSEVLSTQVWEISGHDYNPQTFSIQLMDVGITDDAERPSPGTYSIGNTVNADYTVNFTHIPNGSFSNSVEYSTTYGNNANNGTLTITSSTENTVKGSFECTAYRVDNNLNIIGTIQVVGDFTANKRIN